MLAPIEKAVGFLEGRREADPNELERDSVGERAEELATERLELDRGREALGAGTGSPFAVT